jgi:hypothetical protein
VSHDPSAAQKCGCASTDPPSRTTVEDDAELYPALLQPAPAGAPKEHPNKRAQAAALPILYLVHSKQWEFSRPFILAGGLRALGELMADDNLYLRSQAVESFAQLTDLNEHIDWLASSDHDDAVRFELSTPRPELMPPPFLVLTGQVSSLPSY